MSWIIAVIVGGVIGWFAYRVTKSRISLFWSVAVGAIGGLLANIFNFLGLSDLGQGALSTGSVIAGIIGGELAVLIADGFAALFKSEQSTGKAYYQKYRDRESDKNKKFGHKDEDDELK